MNKDSLMLKMNNISKSFPGVNALHDVSIEVHKGEVLALLGENGAGKSTLMKILSGVYAKDEGEIFIEGEKVLIRDVKQAENLGVAIIHQELSVLQNLTVSENLFLGNEKFSSFTRRINKRAMRERTVNFLEQIGSKVDPDDLVRDINVGDMQLLEIVKAISKNSRIIVMDEPTTALTEVETKNLFRVIKKLKEKGIAIIYISHRMDEIYEICDRVTVLRDGKLVGSSKVSDISREQLITMMVGRKLEEQFPFEKTKDKKISLEVKNLEVKDLLKNISFKAMSGEVLGFAGLMGAGRTELAKAVIGEIKKDSGEIFLEGKKILIKNPKDAISRGICYLSEDRKKEGLVLGLSVRENITLPSLKKFERDIARVSKRKEKNEVEEYIRMLSIKTPGAEQKVKNLSGGNQQKVIIAKWLMTSPKVLIIDEPTKGIDVGAKKEIYLLINKLKAEGKAIIMISSDMPELLGICDRIIVMHQGEIKGELQREEATQESIMNLAIGN